MDTRMMHGPVENYTAPRQPSPSGVGGGETSRAVGGKILWIVAWWVVSVFCDALVLTSRPNTISFWERISDTQTALMNGTMFAIFYRPPAALLSVVMWKLLARFTRRCQEASPRPERSPTTRTPVWTLLVGPLAWYYLCIYGLGAAFFFSMAGEVAPLELVVGLPSASLWGAMYGTAAGIIGLPIFMLLGFAASRGIRAVRRRSRTRP